MRFSRYNVKGPWQQRNVVFHTYKEIVRDVFHRCEKRREEEGGEGQT